MKVMVLVKGCKDAEACAQLPAELARYNEELVQAGVFLALERLQPGSMGKRVRFAGAGRTVIDGPFSETKELLGGFWLWEVKSMEEAVEWLKRAPFDGDTEVEIRPVLEAGSFVPSDGARGLRAVEAGPRG